VRLDAAVEKLNPARIAVPEHGVEAGVPVDLWNCVSGAIWGRKSSRTLFWCGQETREHPDSQFAPHRCILRLQGLYALGYVAIIDVAAIDGSEMAQSGGFIVRDFAGSAEFVVNGEARLLVEAGNG
jgi:hypothetical protein